MRIFNLFKPVKEFFSLLLAFFAFLFTYARKHLQNWFGGFEKQKNVLVKFFLMKRGRYNRPFLHVTAMGVLAVGIVIGPFLAETYPVFSSTTALPSLEATSSAQSVQIEDNVFETKISQKPRDTILDYTVQKGDTLSTIAEKFGIDVDTIKWENNLRGDFVNVGDTVKILPVSGIAYKVSKGDTVYTIAKKYDTNPQKIVDFPFNDFANPETFSLVEGQILIVPDGIISTPTYRPAPKKQQVYIAQGPVSVSSAGFTWPVRGGISQFASWYHMALDITSDVGTPVVAAQSGTVSKALAGTWDGGYGTNIMVDNGTHQTLYAHMSALNVGVGDPVVAGKTVVGWVGLTGRTTGAHLHFEVHQNGALVNPLSYLQ